MIIRRNTTQWGKGGARLPVTYDLWVQLWNSRKYWERALIEMECWWLAHTLADLLMIYSPCKSIHMWKHTRRQDADRWTSVLLRKYKWTEVGVSLCESWLVEFIIQLSTCGLGLRKVNKRHNVAVIMTGKHFFLM